MLEPERPKVDRAVLAFLREKALHPADFTIREDGVVRLNPELARRVAQLVAVAKITQYLAVISFPPTRTLYVASQSAIPPPTLSDRKANR
jgi:hypothetical protein